MKKSAFTKYFILYILVALAINLASTSSYAQTQQCDSWTGIANMSRNSRDNQSLTFSIGNKAYVCQILVGLPYLLEYTPETNTWAQKTGFPGYARSQGVAFSVNGKGYIGLGSRFYTYLQDIWEYDPATDAWTRKNNFPGQGRNNARSFTIGNTAYIGTGDTFDKTNTFNDLWRYDQDEDTWTKVADLPGKARSEAVSFALNGKGFIALGEADTSGTALKDVWAYDPKDNSWEQKNKFGENPAKKAAAFAVNDKGYVCGGVNPENNTGSRKMWEYSPSKDTWTQVADYAGTARISPRSFVIGTTAYVGLGIAINYFRNNFWAYIPCKNKGGRTSAYIQSKKALATAPNVQLYPNPSHDKINVVLPAPTKYLSVAIFNVKGEVVETLENNHEKTQTFLVDLSLQPKGLYFVKITTDRGNTVKQVIIN
ncbi:Kelch repeat-containing protein [Microscilla marina]|nr:kelch repeat-containing protein [Microscilla marina]